MASSHSSNLVKLVVCTIMLMSIVVTSLEEEAYVAEAVSCGQVATSLGPCLSYLRGRGGRVPKACCDGIKSLNRAARSRSDKQRACRCLVSAAGGIKGLNLNLAARLPRRCGVRIPYKISPKTNCSKIR